MQNKRELTFEKLVRAYFDCRRRKRNTYNALRFEFLLERNLTELYDELLSGNYEISTSICFIVLNPKPREVWAANFRDRIVHHLVYNEISERFYRKFIKDTYSCIPERGSLNAVKTLRKYIEVVTDGHKRDCYYLKADIKNFFVSIDKDILFAELEKEVEEEWVLRLLRQIVYHDCRSKVYVKSPKWKFDLLPDYKSLWNTDGSKGLPIGNLTSQFFSNVYLNVLDQYVKQHWHCKYYCRYVDDFVILDEDPQKLNEIHKDLTRFLKERLKLDLHQNKKSVNKVERGIDFVGFVEKPYRRVLRQKILRKVFKLVREQRKDKDWFTHEKLEKYKDSINSYLGMLRNTNGYKLRREICLQSINLFITCDEEYTKLKIVKYTEERIDNSEKIVYTKDSLRLEDCCLDTTQHNTTQHNYRPKEYKSHKELRYITDKEQHLEEINAAFLLSRERSFMKKITAFTLAEVLITLGIIGIVAALTLPAFISNVQGRIQAKRVENINQKLSKVTDKMAVQSGLIGYPDTMAFVQEMKKHMSIAKVCDNSHLSECWGTTEVDVGKDKPWEIAKTKTAKNLKIGEPDNWADTVGIVTADGTPMILSYDKECNFDPNNKGLQYNQSSGKSNSLVCLSGVFDWNGGARPNKLGDDVTLLGMASGLGSSCAFEVGSTCYTAPFPPTPMTEAECNAAVAEGKLGIKGCYDDDDYWAGAVKQCGGVSKMPTMAQLGELASQLYVGNPSVGVKQDVYNLTFDTNSSTAKSLGLTPTFFVWSGEEDGRYYAFYRTFFSSYTEWRNYDRGSSFNVAVCLGD